MLHHKLSTHAIYSQSFRTKSFSPSISLISSTHPSQPLVSVSAYSSETITCDKQPSFAYTLSTIGLSNHHHESNVQQRTFLTTRNRSAPRATPLKSANYDRNDYRLIFRVLFFFHYSGLSDFIRIGARLIGAEIRCLSQSTRRLK